MSILMNVLESELNYRQPTGCLTGIEKEGLLSMSVWHFVLKSLNNSLIIWKLRRPYSQSDRQIAHLSMEILTHFNVNYEKTFYPFSSKV